LREAGGKEARRNMREDYSAMQARGREDGGEEEREGGGREGPTQLDHVLSSQVAAEGLHLYGGPAKALLLVLARAQTEDAEATVLEHRAADPEVLGGILREGGREREREGER